jgi:thiamine biosynthesis lipoprotein
MRRVVIQLAVLVAGLLGCARSAPAMGARLVRVFDACTPMGTYMAVTVYAPDEPSGRQAIAAAFARVEEVEAATSHYRETSEISKLNRGAGGPALPVGPHVWAVLRRSAEVSAETDGAFDVTVGPLVALWKKTWKKGKAPADADLAAARALVDFRSVALTQEGRRVQLPKPGMQFDLGAIAKGYAVDQAVAALRERGIQAALVDAGGDMYAMGAPPERKGWFIGIRDPSQPDEKDRILSRALCIRDQAVATSGDYEQFGVIEGRRYSHILDPRTGRPVLGVASVTVVAPDATSADAYATAMSVLGPEASVAFAEKRPGIEVMAICERGGQFVATRSKGFERLEVTPTAGR